MRNSSLLTLLGVTLLIAVMAQPVQAATPPPSLAGEQFASSTNPPPSGFGGSAIVVSKTCSPDGTGSLTFSADGTATGPYPGTFHEDGTIDLVGGNVTRADASFFITSSVGAVSGTKSFNASANPTASTGGCTFVPSATDPNGFLNFQSQPQQTYSAAITVSQGQFSDSGSGGSTFQTSFQGDTATPQFLNAFTEGFSVSNGVTGKVNPIVTTRATPSAHTGGTISDIATLAGGNSPTGTLLFEVFEPSHDTCTGPSLFQSTVTVTGNGVYPSGPFPAVFVGIFRWVVTYSGDANNSTVITACNNPNEISVVTLTTPTITTSATATANTPGPISDTATLAGGNAPTGTITFSLFDVGDTSCLGTPVQSFAAVTENGSYTSGLFPASLPGTYRWIASYGGDGNNTKATTACNETGEISVVTKTSPTITTKAITSVNVGTLISDTATLSGGNAPSGSIHFQLFGPSDPLCTSPMRDSFKTVNGNLSFTSDVVFAALPGTYRWIATYTGDSNNNGATTACGDAGEISRVKATPTITTQATASVIVGGAIADTATLDGGLAPTGTITFSVFGTSDCSGTALFNSPQTVSGNGPYASDPFTPTSPGTYSWVASYDGDPDNNPVTTACHAAGETSSVIKASPTITTQATGSATMGGTISDAATLAGGNAPTGAISYSLYGPNDAGCTGTPTLLAKPVAGNGVYTSDSFTPLAPGTYRWVAMYSGDANNNTATTACNDLNETSSVSKASPTISTQATGLVTIGGSISDNAKLSGGSAATGTITFSLFGTGDCSGSAVFSSPQSVAGEGAYASGPFTPLAPGTYSWVAAYSGDANNNGVNTVCSDANEISKVIKASPSISTLATATATMGDTISDAATLVGGNVATGTISFNLFGTADCSGPAVFSSPQAVTGDAAASGSFTPLAPGTYRWVAVYSGDANNNSATSLCTDVTEVSVVSKASPTISTSATISVTMGGTISDTATLLGGSAATGTITISVFGTADCSGSAVFNSPLTVVGNGAYASGPFTPLSPGTYNWVASYSGDANNNGFTTRCNAANEVSVVSKANPSISTLATATATMGGTISDTATLLGGALTGTITFSVFATADCSGTALFTSTIPVSTTGNNVSKPYTPLAPGTYRWVGVYSGDANNNLATSLCTDATEVSVVSKATPSITTSADATATMGGSISDTATLAGGTHDGTITFNVFGTADCSGSALFTSTQTVAGDGTYVSGPFTPSAPGTYKWVASYSGDANNNGVTTSCIDANEVSVVSKTSPSISTLATATATMGGSISDTATLAGGTHDGTITFNVFGTADCSGSAVFTSTQTVAGDGAYVSGPFTPLSPGTYNWVTSYSGDANNNSFTTSCNAANETSRVSKATPTVSTSATISATIGGSIYDAATLLGGSAATGTITFSVFGTADCSGSALFNSPLTVAGDGTYTSGSFTPAAPGMYRWVAAYSGDANNIGVTTLCSAANETSNVIKARPTASTQATASAVVGGSISDTATLSGGNAPRGTITFTLFGPNDANCTGSMVFNSTMPVSGTSSTSAAFLPTLPGAYKWVAAYSGDANNNGDSTACGDANETSNVIKASPGISTQATTPPTTGGSTSDTATLTGGNAPTGTVSFSLFGPNDATCAGPALFNSIMPVTGNSSTSAAFVPTLSGTYSWVAAYSGDAGNNPATSACNDPAETLTVVTTVSSQDVNLVMLNVGGFSTGQVGAYIVIVSNTGTVPTTGTLTFTDTLPAGLTYAGSFTFGWSCSVAGQTVTCTYGNPLPVNGLIAMALFVTVTAPGGTVLTNTATVTPLDATPADNTASATVTVRHSWRSNNIDSQSGRNESDGWSQSASAEDPSRGRD